MNGYKTTLGGALSALGKTLMGIGIVPQLAGTPSHLLLWIATTGFLLDAIGGFIGHLFAADSRSVERLQNQMKRMVAIDLCNRAQARTIAHLQSQIRQLIAAQEAGNNL